MDLEGHGGPAIGDIFSAYTEKDIREQFFAVDNCITFQNEY